MPDDPAQKYLDPTYNNRQAARDSIESKRKAGKAMTGDDFYGRVHMQAAMKDIKKENKAKAVTLAKAPAKKQPRKYVGGK